MKDQLKIIREALEFLCLTNSAHDEALTALTQLEAMVGELVAWQRRMKPVWGDRDYLWSPWEECSEGTAEDCWKTPLLHEWAYEARALYTAVPVDQRPRAKEIGEADLDPDEGDPVTLWAEIWRLREAVKGPDGYATWQDAATAERIRRVRAESKHAAPVAQQPQARPDFTDEWTGYLKDGETPFERFLRERKDMQSVLKLYQRVLEENESLKAQQPQAEAVQQKPKLIGWRTSDYLMETSDKDKADNWAVHNEILPIFEGDPYTKLVAAPQQAEAVPQAAEFCWLVEHFDGDGTGNSTGHYYTGKLGVADRVLTTMDANEAKRYDTWREANLASVKLGSTLTGTWRAVQHGFHTIPQQAEAVPLFAALKVEGPRFHCAKVYGRIYQVLAVGSNKEDLLTVARLAKDAYYKQFPGTHEYKEPPFEWVVEEVPTAQPKFQPTEAVPPGYVLVPVELNDALVKRVSNHGVWTEQEVRNLHSDLIDAAIAQQKD